MAADRQLPDDPLELIQQCVRRRSIKWTYHVNMRLRSRDLSRDVVYDSVDSYVILEAYPEDKYLPSYLVYCSHQEEAFHVLFAADVEGSNVRVVTVYRPDPQQWSEDLKKRKQKS